MAEDKKAMNVKRLQSLGPGVSKKPLNGERLRSLDKILNSYATNNPNNTVFKG